MFPFPQIVPHCMRIPLVLNGPPRHASQYSTFSPCSRSSCAARSAASRRAASPSAHPMLSAVQHLVRMLGVRDFHLLNCSFAHLGGAGVSFAGGTQHSSVSGCEFYDISASGVTVGTAMSSYLALDPAAQDGSCLACQRRSGLWENCT